MRGFELFKNGVGVIAVVLFLALASPGVQIVPVASAEEPISAAPPAPRCEAGNPVSADESMAAVVERLSDTIGVMYAGRLVECGEARRVLACPEHPRTRALLEACTT